MADAIEERKDEISLVESHDNGKTPFEAGMEVQMVIDTFRYFAGWTDKVRGDEIPVENGRLNYTTREPVGVTAHIAPWNYPFQLAGRGLAPALATGNSVILKPSAMTPLSARTTETAEEAGLPDGVVNVGPGKGTDAVTHCRTRGRRSRHLHRESGVGLTVQRTAADAVADVTLELGGKGPASCSPTLISVPRQRASTTASS